MKFEYIKINTLIRNITKHGCGKILKKFFSRYNKLLSEVPTMNYNVMI